MSFGTPKVITPLCGMVPGVFDNTTLIDDSMILLVVVVPCMNSIDASDITFVGLTPGPCKGAKKDGEVDNVGLVPWPWLVICSGAVIVVSELYIPLL